MNQLRIYFVSDNNHTFVMIRVGEFRSFFVRNHLLKCHNK